MFELFLLEKMRVGSGDHVPQPCTQLCSFSPGLPVAITLAFSGPAIRESLTQSAAAPREKGRALPVAVSSKEVVEKPRCPFQVTTWPQCSTVGLSFHIYEKLHLCIHCIWKEGYVLL